MKAKKTSKISNKAVSAGNEIDVNYEKKEEGKKIIITITSESAITRSDLVTSVLQLFSALGIK